MCSYIVYAIPSVRRDREILSKEVVLLRHSTHDNRGEMSSPLTSIYEQGISILFIIVIWCLKSKLGFVDLGLGSNTRI